MRGLSNVSRNKKLTFNLLSKVIPFEKNRTIRLSWLLNYTLLKKKILEVCSLLNIHNSAIRTVLFPYYILHALYRNVLQWLWLSTNSSALRWRPFSTRGNWQLRVLLAQFQHFLIQTVYLTSGNLSVVGIGHSPNSKVTLSPISINEAHLETSLKPFFLIHFLA